MRRSTRVAGHLQQPMDAPEPARKRTRKQSTPVQRRKRLWVPPPPKPQLDDDTPCHSESPGVCGLAGLMSCPRLLRSPGALQMRCMRRHSCSRCRFRLGAPTGQVSGEPARQPVLGAPDTSSGRSDVLVPPGWTHCDRRSRDTDPGPLLLLARSRLLRLCVGGSAEATLWSLCGGRGSLHQVRRVRLTSSGPVLTAV